ncbi:alpha/beta hydrolase [Variovorax sp. Varisp36]|uniref:alpha/beta hydrolase n=1 Tax=Variovorax sp. Varisp36 TaxID=3243031 RepID=UPI0039A6C1F9
MISNSPAMKPARRTFLTAGIAATGLALATQTPAQSPARKAPPVWLDLDQEALDKAYDQAFYAQNIETLIKRCEWNTEVARRRIGEPRKIAYGPSEHETLELTTAKRTGAPVHIFVHGGAWRGSSAAQWGYMAEVFVANGIHYVAPDFINVIQAKGSLVPMVEQVQRSIAWVYKNATSFGGDPNRIFLSAHSSGAHLAGVALTTDWQAEFGLPNNIVKGAVLVSGLYDLKPVRLSSRSSYVNFDDEIEHRFSPQRHLHRLSTPLVLVRGLLETPEFIRQSKDFADAAVKAGHPVELITGPQYNHIETVESLGNPFGLAGFAALKQVLG